MINRKLVEAEANEDGAAVRDDRLTSLETKLLNTGSELVSYSYNVIATAKCMLSIVEYRCLQVSYTSTCTTWTSI